MCVASCHSVDVVVFGTFLVFYNECNSIFFLFL